MARRMPVAFLLRNFSNPPKQIQTNSLSIGSQQQQVSEKRWDQEPGQADLGEV